MSLLLGNFVTTGKVQTGRDPFVDWFKGIMILWVIHIHTVYWSGYAYVPEGVRQVTLLADVPIFFFISGYVTRPAAFLSSLRKTIQQFVRLYFHYFVISCLLLGAVLFVTVLLTGWGQVDICLAFSSLFEMVPHGQLWDSIRVYNGSLWYVRGYFSLLVFVPILAGLASFYKIKFNVLLFVLLFTALFPKEYADQGFLFSSYGDVSFYLFFFVLGMILRDQEDHLDTKNVLLSLILSVCLGLVIFFCDNKELFIQRYKFPPAIQYLIYSLPLVHFFVLLKRKLQQTSCTYNGRYSLFLRWCGVNIFYIYLFQGAVCSLPYFFMRPLVAVIHPAILYGLILCFNLVLTLVLSYLYVEAQNIAVFITGSASRSENNV
jgi:hypothetical protein